ncbi:MAG TPA: hypothetical protein PLC61_01645 [Chitinophagales bacterium]|nr:hypothetical protein [Chitinophagales bacterium]MCB0513080.1 hypothetical protein [Bacteroidota bacterium]MCB9075067.1 hypothetical protein [Chitinophagales bacterium]HMU98589.1 hypothetical protein [Chitinophagales bacterium]HMV03131.1 hypothetical protein [Chitinophagales bacterium]
MKKIIYFAVLALLTSTSFGQEHEPVKEYKFKFKAGVASTLHFYKQHENEIGYKKVALGNGLGTELGYYITKKISVNLHYYLHYYKNPIKNSGAPFLSNKFHVNQQNHIIATTVGFTVFQKKSSSIIINTGPGFTIKNEQVALLDPLTKIPTRIIDNKSFKYVQPISINIENFIKNKIILGAGIQTFIFGEKQPLKGACLFSYLGLPF